MNQPILSRTLPPDLSCHFDGEGAIRGRSVGNSILVAELDVPALPPRLTADCERQIFAALELEPGDVEALSLPRARARWPDYSRCLQIMSDWTDMMGLPALLATAEVALMACRGARYHHDADQYGDSVFCNLFLSDDKGLDLHFPLTGQRIALQRGSVALFDTGQPHAVIQRGSSGFDMGQFAAETDCTLLFLSWELPLDNARLAQALGINFDRPAISVPEGENPQLFLSGKPGSVCPSSGLWLDNPSPGCG